jgi:hypothetical protein
MDRLRSELAAVHKQIREYKAMVVARSEQLAAALDFDAAQKEGL